MTKLSNMHGRPPTVAIHVRLDARHLATLATFWLSNGETPRSVSELTRLSLESLVHLLVDMGKVEFITTQADATEVLSRMGLRTTTIPTKLVEALRIEDAPDHMIDSLTRSLRPDASAVRHRQESPTIPSKLELDGIVAKMEELMSTTPPAHTPVDTSAEDIRKHFGIPPNPTKEP